MPYKDPDKERESQRQRSKKWRLANPEKVRESSARQYRNNVEYFRKKNAKWRANNQYRKRELIKKWEEENPDARRRIYLFNMYGVTPSFIDGMLEGQDHKCAICGDSIKLVVDHCHLCGKGEHAVRSMKCNACNRNIAQAEKHDIEWFDWAKADFQKHLDTKEHQASVSSIRHTSRVHAATLQTPMR